MSKRQSSGTEPPPDPDLALERLRRHLVFLGLSHIHGHLDELLAWALHEKAGPTALLEHVLSAEVDSKLDGRIARRIATSGLREHKTLEAFDWNFQPTLDKAFLMELARLGFVHRKDDLVITGKSGTGRSHLLMAFGRRACEQGIRLR